MSDFIGSGVGEEVDDLIEDVAPQTLDAFGVDVLVFAPGTGPLPHAGNVVMLPSEARPPEAHLPAAGDVVEDEQPLRGLDLQGAVALQPRDPHKDRFTLTSLILGITAIFTVAAAWILLVADDTVWGRLQSQLGFLLTPFHTLLGIAIGYYFADKNRDKD